MKLGARQQLLSRLHPSSKRTPSLPALVLEILPCTKEHQEAPLSDCPSLGALVFAVIIGLACGTPLQDACLSLWTLLGTPAYLTALG